MFFFCTYARAAVEINRYKKKKGEKLNYGAR